MEKIAIYKYDYVVVMCKKGLVYEYKIGLVRLLNRKDRTARVWFATGGTTINQTFNSIIFASPKIQIVLLYFKKEKLAINNNYALPALILRKYAIAYSIESVDITDLIEIV